MDDHWRYTQRPARFFMFDARASAMLFLFLVHISLTTGILAILSMLVFWVLERAGLSFHSAVRASRCYILGRNRPANHRRARRRIIDYG